MSQSRNKPNSRFRVSSQKAGEYEEIADHLLETTEALAYAEVETDLEIDSYEEMSASKKFQVLTEFYNNKMGFTDPREMYQTDDLIEYVASISDSPESVQSSQKHRGRSLEKTGSEVLEDLEGVCEGVTDREGAILESEPDRQEYTRFKTPDNNGEWIDSTWTINLGIIDE